MTRITSWSLYLPRLSNLFQYMLKFVWEVRYTPQTLHFCDIICGEPITMDELRYFFFFMIRLQHFLHCGGEAIVHIDDYTYLLLITIIKCNKCLNVCILQRTIEQIYYYYLPTEVKLKYNYSLAPHESIGNCSCCEDILGKCHLHPLNTKCNMQNTICHTLCNVFGDDLQFPSKSNTNAPVCYDIDKAICVAYYLGK